MEHPHRQLWENAKNLLVLCAALALFCGCATSSVEKRKQERYGAYSQLSPDTKTLVDQGKIKVGMSPDAVYIALGKPSQILRGESSAGSTTTWLYQGTYLEPYRYWSYRNVHYGNRYYAEPRLEYDYHPRSFVQTEIIFENDAVKEWRSLPQPPHGY